MVRKVKLLLIGLYVTIYLSQVCPAQSITHLRHPALLKPGDTIMFIAPAGSLSRERIALAKKRLEERGYKIKMRDDVFTHTGYLAGSDERRAEELMQAFRDPEVDAIFPGTGGYGTTRILDMLDYEVIRQNPKLFIGFSDITALHAAFNKLGGFVTYHTPAPMYGLGSDTNLTPFSAEYFFRAVEQSPLTSQDYVINCQSKGDKVPQPVALGKGKARGRLTGGNLSLLAAIEGTPYSIDTRDAILLIEDVGEAPYRIDRMLQQLKSAGKFDGLRGVVAGQFTETERVPTKVEQYVNFAEKLGKKMGRHFLRLFIDVPEPKEEKVAPRFTAEGVLRQYFEPLGVPVLLNFPIGHYKMNCSLPLGGEVEIDADKATLTVIGHKP